MADVKISALPAAGALAASDVLPIVQPTGTTKVAVSVLDSRWVASTGGSVTGALTVNPYIAIGTNPATDGVLRLPALQQIKWRNGANTGNGGNISTDASDHMTYASPGWHRFLAGTEVFTVRSNAVICTQILSAPSVSLGTSPAGTGIVRLPNNQYVTFRDSTNASDLRTFGRDSTNRIVVGTNDPGGSGLDLRGRPDIGFHSGATKIGEMGLTHFSMGTNPAASGIVRLPNDQAITARNAANTADVPMLKVSAAGTVQYWNGTAWADIAGTGGGGTPAGTELFYGQITANITVTATNPATPMEIIPGSAITYDGSPVWVEFFAPLVQSVASGDLQIALWDSTTNSGRMGTLGIGGGAQGMMAAPCYLKRRITPTAGSHTFRVCAAGPGSPRIEAGLGTGTAQPPAFLRITKA
jgi:hypothetical protein